MVEVEGLEFEVGGGAVEDASFAIERGQRVALLGPNGSGKTTLLETLSAAAAATGGKLKLGHNVDRRLLLAAVAGAARLAPGDRGHHPQRRSLTGPQARDLLGLFLFSADRKAGVGALRRRAPTAGAGPHRRSGADFLVLDEPTNHLDIESREALEDALEAYPRDAASGLPRPRPDRGPGHPYAGPSRSGRCGCARAPSATTRGPTTAGLHTTPPCLHPRAQRQGRRPSPSQPARRRPARAAPPRPAQRASREAARLEREIAALEEELGAIQTRLSAPDEYRDDEARPPTGTATRPCRRSWPTSTVTGSGTRPRPETGAGRHPGAWHLARHRPYFASVSTIASAMSRRGAAGAAGRRLACG